MKRGFVSGVVRPLVLLAGIAPLAACASFPRMQTSVISAAPADADAQAQIDKALKRPTSAADQTVRKPATAAQIDALVSD
mgnify:FL=1